MRQSQLASSGPQAQPRMSFCEFDVSMLRRKLPGERPDLLAGDPMLPTEPVDDVGGMLLYS
jgi:hypothetical protein